MADRIRAAGEHPVAYGVATGRFASARADFWAEQYLADPAGTTATIESMAPILVMAGVHQVVAGSPDVDEFAHLFPPTRAAYDAAAAAMTDDELMAELFGPEV